MSATDLVARDERRAKVARLATQGLSLRDIARQVGAGKDAVRRDLNALNASVARQAAPQVSDAPGGAAASKRRATTPVRQEPGSVMDAPAPSVARAPVGARRTQRRATAGRRWRARRVASRDTPPSTAPRAATAMPDPATDSATLTIPMTDQLARNLAVLERAGLNRADAITMCLGFVATAVTDCWAHAVCPSGTLPQMKIRSYGQPLAPLPPLVVPPTPAAPAGPARDPRTIDPGPSLGRPRFYPYDQPPAGGSRS